MYRLAVFAAAAALTAPAVFADFSYEQTTKMTGGAMMSMMKVAGAFNKSLREPVRSTVYVKGDRMAHVTGTTAQVIDISKETITAIDYQKKQYSVMTFAQLAEAMKQAEAKMNEKKDPNQPEMNLKADVKSTGQKRQIQGLEASQTILTIDMEAKNEQGKQGTMRITSDMWLAPNIAGYEEVRNFYQRMAAKLNWAPGGNMFTQGQSGFAKAFANLYKEGAKIDGVPVLQITKFGATGDAAAQAQAQNGQPAPQQQAQTEEKPSVGGALGKLGGRFGGLGRFGKKKEEQPAPQQAQTQSPSSAPAAGGPPTSLMEFETESSNFSSAAVDASKFEVPAGFKQVESETLKQMKR